MKYAPANARAKRTSSDRVRRDARRRAELDERRGDEDAEPETGRRRDAVRQPDARRVAARVEVEQRRARRAQRGAGREALHAAGDEEPGGRVGEHEQHRRARERRERDEQHRPAADLVGDPAGEEQRREHAEGVGGVDQRERERREAPELAVGLVERRRRDRREQAEPDHGRGEGVGARRSTASSARRGRPRRSAAWPGRRRPRCSGSVMAIPSSFSCVTKLMKHEYGTASCVTQLRFAALREPARFCTFLLEWRGARRRASPRDPRAAAERRQGRRGGAELVARRVPGHGAARPARARRRRPPPARPRRGAARRGRRPDVRRAARARAGREGRDRAGDVPPAPPRPGDPARLRDDDARGRPPPAARPRGDRDHEQPADRRRARGAPERRGDRPRRHARQGGARARRRRGDRGPARRPRRRARPRRLQPPPRGRDHGDRPRGVVREARDDRERRRGGRGLLRRQAGLRRPVRRRPARRADVPRDRGVRARRASSRRTAASASRSCSPDARDADRDHALLLRGRAAARLVGGARPGGAAAGRPLELEAERRAVRDRDRGDGRDARRRLALRAGRQPPGDDRGALRRERRALRGLARDRPRRARRGARVRSAPASAP